MAFRTLVQHIDIEWLKEADRRKRKKGTVAWADRPRRSTQRIWRTSTRYWKWPSPARTALRQYGGSTSPREMGRRRGPSAVSPSRTRSWSERWPWRWKPSTSRTSSNARTASGRDGQRIRRWKSFWCEAVRRAGGWVLEIDIRRFFDTLVHGHLRTLLRRRIGDGVLLRLIGKWRNTRATGENAPPVANYSFEMTGRARSAVGCVYRSTMRRERQRPSA